MMIIINYAFYFPAPPTSGAQSTGLAEAGSPAPGKAAWLRLECFFLPFPGSRLLQAYLEVPFLLLGLPTCTLTVSSVIRAVSPALCCPRPAYFKALVSANLVPSPLLRLPPPPRLWLLAADPPSLPISPTLSQIYAHFTQSLPIKHGICQKFARTRPEFSLLGSPAS